MEPGISDITKAAKFFIHIYNNLRNADKDFEGIANTVKELGAQLENLSKMLEGQKRKIEVRRGIYEGDEYIWSIPGQILGDWQALRDQIDSFMKKHNLYHESKTTAKIKQILWRATGDMQDENKRLTSLLSFHIQKVQLLATTLHLKFQADMSDRQDEFHKELASKMDILLERTRGPADQTPKATTAEYRRESPCMWLYDLFASKFQEDFGGSQDTLTLSKLVDLSVWWHVQGVICEPNSRLAITVPSAHIYKFVYFTKAHWLLRKIFGLEEYHLLNASSIWSQYIGELSEKVSADLECYQDDLSNQLTKKSLEQLEGDDPGIFDIENSRSIDKFQSQQTLTETSKLEILRLSLRGYPPREVDKTMIIYRSEYDRDQYTCEVLTVTKKQSDLNLLASVPSRSLNTFPISICRGQLILTYIFGTKHEATTLHLRGSEGSKRDEFDFHDIKDMFNFQKALTGHSVQANLAQVPSINFRLSNVIPRTVKYSNVRIQIWLEVVQRDRRSSESTSDTSQTSKSDEDPIPNPKNVLTSSFPSERIMTVQMLSRVEVAHIMVFGKTELPHEKQVLWIIRINHSTELDHEKCCTRTRKNTPDNVPGQCCERMVIRGKVSAIKLTQEDNRKPLGFPLDRKFLHYFNTKIDSAIQETIHLQWLALDFLSKKQKQQFAEKFTQLRRLSLEKMVEQRKEQQQYLMT